MRFLLLIVFFFISINFTFSQRIFEAKKISDSEIKFDGIIEKNVLTRYPPKGDFIANLARGGKYKINVIKKKHLNHLKSVASYLRYQGIFFAVIDMIGDYITEVNITSPTGVQQIKSGLSLRIAKELIKEIKNYKTQ